MEIWDDLSKEDLDACFVIIEMQNQTEMKKVTADEEPTMEEAKKILAEATEAAVKVHPDLERFSPTKDSILFTKKLMNLFCNVRDPTTFYAEYPKESPHSSQYFGISQKHAALLMIKVFDAIVKSNEHQSYDEVQTAENITDREEDTDMSAATKRKHVVKEMLEDFSMPKSNQTIVQVQGNAGSNLHEVLTPEGQKFLASLPMQFRKTIWIKRGDFVVIEPIAEGDKVKAEIVRVLYPQHIKAIKKCDLWPSRFDKLNKDKEDQPDSKPFAVTDNNNEENAETRNNPQQFDDLESEESEDDFSDIPMNTNRPTEVEFESEDETSEEDE